MLDDVSESHTAISSVYQCMYLGPNHKGLGHSIWMYLTLIGQQNADGTPLESWRFVVEYELNSQLLWYSVAILINGISNGHTLITIHALKQLSGFSSPLICPQVTFCGRRAGPWVTSDIWMTAPWTTCSTCLTVCPCIHNTGSTARPMPSPSTTGQLRSRAC